MDENQSNRTFVFIAIGLILLIAISAMLMFLLVDRANRQPAAVATRSRNAAATSDPMELVKAVASQTAAALTESALMVETAAPTPDPMNLVAMVASQTAAALTEPALMVKAAASQTALALTEVAPTATLLPNEQYWVPPAADGFLPRFTYASTQWALVDASTLASLQTSGCTLRRAGGRALGPDWSTEQGAFTAGGLPFVTVLAKYQGEAQFITYSAPNGAVFEIASSTAAGFEKCQQDGESVLKSLSLH